MFLVFRCDCGRVLYSKDSVKTRKCPCGKSLNVKQRRVLYKTTDLDTAIKCVQELQDEFYHNTGFISATELK